MWCEQQTGGAYADVFQVRYLGVVGDDVFVELGMSGRLGDGAKGSPKEPIVWRLKKIKNVVIEMYVSWSKNVEQARACRLSHGMTGRLSQTPFFYCRVVVYLGPGWLIG